MIKHLILFVILLAGVCFISAQEPPEASSLKAAEQATLHGRYDEAIKLYQKIIKASPENYPAYLGLARAYLETGKYEHCLKTYQTIIKQLPDNPEAQTGSAELLLIRGKYKKAEQLLTKLLQTDSKNLKAHHLLGQLYLRIGKYDEAEQEGKFFTTLKQEEISKLSADQLLELAKGLWFYATRVGEKDIFHQVINEILPAAEKLNQDNPALYSFWGFCYLDKGDIPSAADCFKDALKVNPNYPRALLGIVYCIPSQKQKLVQPSIKKVLDINPNLTAARKFLATVHLDKEQYETALTEIQKALAINPNEISLRGTRASIYYLNNDLKELEAECKNILKVNPKPAVFYYILGNNCIRRMNYPDAQPFYRKAVELDPRFWEGYVALGLNCMRVGAEAEAEGRKLLEEAFKRDPFNVMVVNYLKLLDALEEEYSPIKSKHFIIKLHKSEKELLEPYVVPLLEEAYGRLTKLYKFEPAGPLLCEIFPIRSDFSVRMAGIPGIGFALGVCFAKTFLVYSPKVQEYLGKRFHWGAVTIHEFTHIITLQLSRFRVPRWFTEGCSVYSEKQSGWGRELARQIYEAYQAGKLQHLDKFCQKKGFDLIHTYLLSSLIIEYIHKTYGMDKIIAMLKGFADRKKQDQVFKECLGKSLKEFDAEFFDYFENTWLPQNIKLRKRIDSKTEPQWQQRLQENLEDAEALANLARIALAKNRLLEAQQYADKALAVDPKNVEASLVMGDLFYQKKSYSNAIKYFEQGIQSSVGDFVTHFRLACSYFREGRKDKAIKEFERAKQCFPAYAKRNDNPYYYLAAIYEERGETDKMIRELEKMVEINHNDFATRLKLAKLCWKQDRVDTMIKLLEDAAYIEPENSKLHSWLGTAYKKKKMYEKALQEYKIVIFLLAKLEETPKRNHKISEYYCKTAELYIDLGQRDPAREHLKLALEYNPGNERARELEKRLEGE